MKSKRIYLVILTLVGLLACLGPVQTVSADGTGRINSFKADDTNNDYRSVATVDGTWGANLFEGNDDQKVFIKILPKDSQWQVYGYTKRADGYYYNVGGNLWLQGNQAKVPVTDDNDASLNVFAHHPEDDIYPFDLGKISDMADYPEYMWWSRKLVNSPKWGTINVLVLARMSVGNGVDWIPINWGYLVYPDGTVVFEDNLDLNTIWI